MKGTIAFVKEVVKGKSTFYSMKVGDTWYGTGKENPGSKGDVIEFDTEQSGDYMNAGNIRKVSAAPSTAVASSSSGSTGTNWAKKDELDQKRFEFDQQKHFMICQQAARNAANALIGLAVQTGLEGAPDSYTKLVAESNKLTKQFYDSTVNLGAGAGSSTAPAKKAPVEPEFDDALPFG